jgi:hypothetical protein
MIHYVQIDYTQVFILVIVTISATLFLGKRIMAIRQEVQDILTGLDGLVAINDAEKATEIKAAVDAALADANKANADLASRLQAANDALSTKQADLESANADHNAEVEALQAEVAKLRDAFDGPNNTAPVIAPVEPAPAPQPVPADNSGGIVDTGTETPPADGSVPTDGTAA